MGSRLTPSQLLRLWHRSAGTEEERVVWFGNRIADELLDEGSEGERASLLELRLNPTTYRTLRRAGYEWIDQVAKLSVRELKTIRMVGLNRAIQIRQAIERWKLTRPAGR